MIKRPDVMRAMGRRPIATWLALGIAAAALSACDEAKSRADALGKLAGCAQAQLAGKDVSGCAAGSASGDAAVSAASAASNLADAPLAARAIAGVQQAPVAEVQTASLEERIRTESFFAIGSVIAKPKEELSEPAVDPASFDVDAVNAPPQAAPAPPTTSPAAPPPAATVAPNQPAPGAASPNRDLRIRPVPMIRALPKAAVRERLRIDPGALERATREATKDTGVKVTQEIVKEAQQIAQQKIEVNSRTAQSVGDEIVRRSRDQAKPIPRALAVRSQLNVDRTLVARDRAFARLEKLGLSGAVTPEEGGTMRITIGVSPTKLNGKFDPSKIASMRALFASDKLKPGQDCAAQTDNAKLQTDLVLATECAVKELKASGDYEYVEKDYIFTNQMLRRPKSTPPLTNGSITPQPGKPSPVPGPVSLTTPNDPLFSLQWDFKELGAAAGQSLGGAGFGNFWTRAKITGSKQVTVAMVDTGLQMSHPDIKNSPHIAPGFDMITDPLIANDGDGPDADANDPGDKGDLMDPDEEDSFHGTHVAGTIGAGFTNNGAGVAGGAWDVTIVPVRALGRCGGRLSDINSGIRWAAGVVAARDAAGNQVWNAHPADIINLSIGLFQPCPDSMQSAIDDAVAAGAIVVVAAGNDRVDTKNYAPGGCKNVISVAAGDGRGYIAPYSNFGANVAMLAPGGDMTRDDDHDGRPDGILSTKLSKNCYDPVTKATVAECYYSYEQGTSMAAPHVTAALALLKSKFPTAAPSKLQAMLMTSTSSREPLQCSGKCSDYPGTTPIPGQAGMCTRACGGRILNLSNAPLQ